MQHFLLYFKLSDSTVYFVAKKSLQRGILLVFFVSGTLDGDTEKYIDKSYVLMFSITDENKSWYIYDNINTYTEAGRVNSSDADFKESNLMHCKIKDNFLIHNVLNSHFCGSV